MIYLSLITAGLAIAALGLCLHVRDKFLAEPDSPGSRCEWEPNEWLKAKQLALGASMRRVGE